MVCLVQGFPTWGSGPAGGVAAANLRRQKKKIFSIWKEEIITKYHQIRRHNLKMIIMIVVNISAWGSPNVHYLDMGVTCQKGWETLV